ncbi:hypothetical protein BC826DRAFT_995974 [Russula brevipes]|nr:hypothetical protein BC826DRAFT_995974 [Russula brevipes]
MIIPFKTGTLTPACRVPKGHTSYVFCVNYNTQGTQHASGGCDGDVRIWNAAKGRCSKTSDAHLDYVTAVHFNRTVR